MIALEGVTRAYVTGGPPVPVLHRTDLRSERGERVALVGASGSGKSTLLHIPGGLDRPTGGGYRYAGQDVGVMDGIRLATFRRDHIGFVFQAFHLLPVLTTIENVELPLVYAGLPAAARRRRAADLLERLGLGRHLRHRPNHLSGGRQQRVASARTLVNDPAETVLADGPTGNLDSRAGAGVVSLLEAQHVSGRTVIVVTHDEALAARCPRVLRTQDGRIVAEQGGPPA